ncbi:hypothetical protein F3Y22_tig00003969pilonHSYRG00008 [Hibiscus syriacus]|uniref:IBH1-like N-terminal domain-containing protein n=1 Tax=Hibiscus syriacus TaxID=106335 RepID=A0A6A3CI87_HIBSY|nr:transcription factor IBH1-like 1 [Hibiscus syriacus]KAE8729135.1 hypothetical protein F3Y22_tig00003969pilonHSYRG00008 [Hibiscus syriacus]
MRSPGPLKQKILKKWMMGLQRCKKNMSILERKRAIKLSADVAMASLRNDAAYWSRVLIAKAVNEANNKKIVQKVFTIRTAACNKRIIRSKKILKRARRRRKRTAQASSITKGLVRKRRRILKSLIPGGEFMNGVTLIEETLDYIISLRAQFDVMESLARFSENQSQ